VAKPAYRGPWQRIRRAVLIRDGWTCRINGPGCTTRATTCDHIIEHDRGGLATMSNLRAACAHCNYSRGARYRNGGGSNGSTPSRDW
jgi:5-methylcytosine-specific restriction endonuclease McrA